MSTISERITAFLEECEVTYQIIHHKRDFTAQRTAEDTHTPGRGFAKTVVMVVDGAYALAVVPADYHVDLLKTVDWLDAGEVRLATEQEILRLFPDCEVGAQPPFGNLYGLPVFVSPRLGQNEYITFNAGTHEDAIRMRYHDFKATAHPAVLELAN